MQEERSGRNARENRFPASGFSASGSQRATCAGHPPPHHGRVLILWLAISSPLSCLFSTFKLEYKNIDNLNPSSQIISKQLASESPAAIDLTPVLVDAIPSNIYSKKTKI